MIFSNPAYTSVQAGLSSAANSIQRKYAGISYSYKCNCSKVTNTPFLSSNQFFRPSVSMFVNRSVVERLRPQFFTDFHQILHAAQKCGRINAYCLWDKAEVVCRF